MTGSMFMERKMVKVALLGQMAAPTSVNSKKIIFKDKVLTTGLTAGCSLVPGLTIRWKATELSLGQMVENMKVTMSMTKKKVKALSTGQMVVNMKVAGKMENSTEMDTTRPPAVKSSKANGTKVRGSTGSTIKRETPTPAKQLSEQILLKCKENFRFFKGLD